MTAPSFWHPENALVRLRVGNASAVVCPLDPAGGLSEWHVDSAPLSTLHALRVEIAAVDPRDAQHQLDPYVRGGDLVATYVDRPTASMRTQIYWRADHPTLAAAAAAVELVVSVQTNLLDSCPRFSVSSELVASEAFQLVDAQQARYVQLAPPTAASASAPSAGAPGGYLFRIPGSAYSFAQIVAPGGIENTDWQVSPDAGYLRLQIRHHLFAEFLEKGVILRARVLGLLVDRDDDLAAVARLYQNFLATELPLTT